MQGRGRGNPPGRPGSTAALKRARVWTQRDRPRPTQPARRFANLAASHRQSPVEQTASYIRTGSAGIAATDRPHPRGASGRAGPWRNVGRPSYFFSSQGAWNCAASDLLSAQLPPKGLPALRRNLQGHGAIWRPRAAPAGALIVLQALERQHGRAWATGADGCSRRWRQSDRRADDQARQEPQSRSEPVAGFTRRQGDGALPRAGEGQSR